MPGTLGDDFAEFWSIWTKRRRVCKKDALRAYLKARMVASKEEIHAGAAAYARLVEEVEDREPRHIAHPTTWLNREQWNDEPPPAPAKPDPNLEWRHAVEWYHNSEIGKKMWRNGPKPDEPGCYAPIEILAEFGYRRAH